MSSEAMARTLKIISAGMLARHSAAEPGNP